MDTDENNQKSFFETNFPAELLQSAKAKSIPGGIYDPGKAGFMKRLIFKLATKQSAYADSIDDDKTTRFVKKMTE